jgi:hypothetical protein
MREQLAEPELLGQHRKPLADGAAIHVARVAAVDVLEERRKRFPRDMPHVYRAPVQQVALYYAKQTKKKKTLRMG